MSPARTQVGIAVWAARARCARTLEMLLADTIGGWVHEVADPQAQAVLARHATHHAFHAELWDAVRIAVSPNEPVVTVKRAALEALAPADEQPEEFVMKLRGWEVLDEGSSLVDAGATNGSIFLLTHRRRRPVR